MSENGQLTIQGQATSDCATAEAKFKPDLNHFVIGNFGGGVQMNVLSPMKIVEKCKIMAVEADERQIKVTTSFKARMRGQQQESFLWRYTKSTYNSQILIDYVWDHDSSGNWPSTPAETVQPYSWQETTP